MAPHRRGEAGEQFDHLVGGARVQRPGRLVGEEHAPTADHGAGDRDALLLTTGEVVRVPVELLGEADGGQRIDGKRAGFP